MSKAVRGILFSLVLLFLVCGLAPCALGQTPYFTSGNLVVSVEGNGVVGGSGTYGDNQAAPLTLFQYQLNAANPTTATPTYVNSLVLPQTASGANLPVSGEYGSSSEGSLQVAGSGQYLTVMGYGVNAATFNSNPDAYSAAANTALAQSGSLTGQSYTPVPRVVALVDPYGNVNSSTALYNTFSGNNPRSVYTSDGLNLYVSGQGTSGDATGGVFFTTLGSGSGTAITGADGGSGVNQDTRSVQIYNGTLYVSLDSKAGATNRSYIGTLGNPPSTTLYNSAAGPTQLAMANNASTPVAVTTTGKLTLTASEVNTINSSGLQINLSPENYFFANAYTLYVADSGSGKQTSATSTLGDGGLQKWINTKTDGTGTWELQYTMSQGLNLVENTASNANDTTGTTGLLGVAGVVNGSNVYLFATNYTIADLDPTYLYGISDPLAATTNPGTSFTQLAAAPANSNFKGVAFAPTLPAGSTTITSTPSGLAFTSTGSGCVPGSYTTPVTLIWTQSSSCTLSVTSPQSGVGTQYVFNQWTDGTTATSDTVTAPVTSTVVNAGFTTNYLLITAAGTGGTVSAGGYYASGTQATITATPNTGYHFTGWVSSPDAVADPTSATTTIAMNAEESVTASFAVNAPATITSPANGSTLTGVSTTFTWNLNGSIAPVYLHVGTTYGGIDLVNIGPLTGNSVTISLPVTGATIYVTVESQLNGQSVDSTNTYTEATLYPATITSPVNGSTLTGTSTTFTWAMNGSTGPVYLHVGTTYGGIDLVNIGPLTGTSATVTLPSNGAVIYATLESQLYGRVDITNTYNEVSLPAQITSPAPGSTLPGASTTFTWTLNGSTAPVYLHVGTTVGGIDLVNIGPLAGTSTTVMLPANGATIYVTLESQFKGATVDIPYTYTEASLNAATITSPANGSQLGSTQTFTWVYNNSTDPVYLHIGSTPGGIDIVNIGPITGGSTTVNLPTDGATVYVTLESQVNGVTVDVPYTYTDPTTASPSNRSRNSNAIRATGTSQAVTTRKK
jgi:hypothetical protein